MNKSEAKEKLAEILRPINANAEGNPNRTFGDFDLTDRRAVLIGAVDLGNFGSWPLDGQCETAKGMFLYLVLARASMLWLALWRVRL